MTEANPLGSTPTDRKAPPEAAFIDKDRVPEEAATRLFAVTQRLNQLHEPVTLGTIGSEAYKMKQEGLLHYESIVSGSAMYEEYFLPAPGSHDSRSRLRVVSIESAPNFHTGQGWKSIGYERTSYDAAGRVTAEGRYANDGAPSTERRTEYHANGATKRTEFHEYRGGAYILADPDSQSNDHWEEVAEFDENGNQVSRRRMNLSAESRRAEAKKKSENVVTAES